VQAGAGVELFAKPGDAVKKGQPIMTLHTDTPERFTRAFEALVGGWSIGEKAAPRMPLILDRITE
jgi:thymidine phosphorylase